MCISAKTILATYGRYGKYAAELGDLVREAALRSFYDTTPCEMQAERILSFIEKRNLLLDLKHKARRAMRSLSDEDLNILAARKRKEKRNLYCSSRTFFRYLGRAERKFAEALALEGITDEVFEREYASKICFLSNAEAAIREQERLASRTAKLKLNTGFATCAFRKIDSSTGAQS